jgi:type I restriction enzyme, S subunit
MPDNGTTLGELAAAGHLELGDGYRTKRSEHGKPGIPILRVAEVLDGEIAPSFQDHVHESYRPKMNGKISRIGDVVLTTKGTVGRVALMPENSAEFVYSPQLCYFRARPNGPLLGRYLYYWFRSDSFWSQAGYRKSQTDMADYINLADIRSLSITLPPITRQQATCDVLGALDDKIAANERLVPSCDELRHLEFEQFLRAHPESVAEVPLSSTADFVNGRAFTKNATGAGRIVVRIAELNSGPGSSTVYNDIEVAPQHLARAGDVLFAWSGSLTLARWYRDEAIVNQHIFKVVPREGIPTWLAFELIARKLDRFKAIAAGKATTMGHIQRHHLDELVQVPNHSGIANLDDRMQALWSRALAAEMESLRLIQVRDALLPGLMSGQIRVREAEEAVEKAT